MRLFIIIINCSVNYFFSDLPKQLHWDKGYEREDLGSYKGELDLV